MVREICKWVKEVCPIPFFAKLTPNVTDIRLIARAAKEGGADGVTAINTVSSLQTINFKGHAWPAVGSDKKTTYGGMSGNATRPIALKAVSSIANHIPDFPILATGGIDCADAALQFLYCGASVVQICSSIQNQEFTVIQDYISGLKCLLYLKAKEGIEKWEGQSPPTIKNFIETIKPKGKRLPRFGHFQQERWNIRKEYSQNHDVLEVEAQKVEQQPVLSKEISAVPSIKDLIGLALPTIGNYTDLNNKEQAVALVDEDLCINCGKCYMTCNDSGYQAIVFDKDTHLPFITQDCTGCTLCVSVCPIPDCITMVPRTFAYIPTRGIQPDFEPYTEFIAHQKSTYANNNNNN